MADAPPISTTATDATVRSEDRVALYGICGLIVLLLGVYFPVLRNMVSHWSAVEDYQHGFIIVPLALFFAWEKRWDLQDARIDGSWWGLLPLGIGLVSLSIGRLGTELMTLRSGFVFTLIGLVLLILGKDIAKILAFPMGFLFLMIPLPQSLVNTIAFPLQLFAAKVAVLSLQELGIPALVEGNIIHLAHSELFVAEACSGLRSLMALITLGVVFAYFFKRGRLVAQVVLVLSTIPIAVVVNAARVALTGILTHYYGLQAAQGVIHEFQGIITFTVAFALLMAEARLMDLGAHLVARRRAGRPTQ